LRELIPEREMGEEDEESNIDGDMAKMSKKYG
jgi:hypothetical protein